jgi:hypothetical protein
MSEDHMGGDCYVVAGHYALEHPLEEHAHVCHGTAIGHGPIRGVRFGHAWIEVGDVVIDQSNGNDAVMPKSVYYEAGQIMDVHRYTCSEAIRMMAKHEHFGPWEGEWAE